MLKLLTLQMKVCHTLNRKKVVGKLINHTAWEGKGRATHYHIQVVNSSLVFVKLKECQYIPHPVNIANFIFKFLFVLTT